MAGLKRSIRPGDLDTVFTLPLHRPPGRAHAAHIIHAPEIQCLRFFNPPTSCRPSTFHVLCGLESFTNAAAWSAKDEKEEKCKREERRGGYAKRCIRFWSTSTPIKIGLLFPSSPTDFPLCIGVLENLLLFSLYFVFSQNHLGWFVEKPHSKLRTGTQTCPTTRPLEPSSPLENITINDLRRSLETIDRPLSTLIRLTFTSIVLRDCEEGQSLLMSVL